MAINIDWQTAIAFMQSHQEAHPDDWNTNLLWERLKNGDRTQDLLMTVAAIKSMQDTAATNSPQWQAATKWLNYQRAQKSDLFLDMLWKQMESGDRTDELLGLIRDAANRSVAPPPPPPSTPIPVVPEAPKEPEGPPPSTF